MSKEFREQVINAAREAVLKDRNKDYGNPEDNFRNIVNLWNTRIAIRLRTLGLKLVRRESGEEWDGPILQDWDPCIWMQDVKTARIEESPKMMDHWSDGAGYNACGYDVVMSKEE